MKHNCVINNGYELFSPDGRLLKKNSTDITPDSEGEWLIESNRGTVSAPARSLQPGFFRHNFGRVVFQHNDPRWDNRVYNFSSSTLSDGMIFSSSSAPTFTTSTSTFCSEMPNLTEDQDHNPVVEMALSRSGVINNGGNINNLVVGLVSGYVTCKHAQETVSPAFSVAPGDQIRLTYTLRFPVSDTASLTKNFFYNWLGAAGGMGNVEFTDLEGNPVGINNDTSHANGSNLAYWERCFIASEGSVNKGIVIGTGNTQVAWDDSGMSQPIAAADMLPSAETVADIRPSTYDSGGTAYTWAARTFTNVSSSDITVREAGVVSLPDNTSGVQTISSFLLARWTLGDGVTVAPGESLRIFFQPTIYF